MKQDGLIRKIIIQNIQDTFIPFAYIRYVKNKNKAK